MKHERKCHDCGNVAEHLNNVTPEVICKKCGSRDTRATKMPEPPPRIDDLAMLVRRLSHRLILRDPQDAVARDAAAYLQRKGLGGSILREGVDV